MYSTYVLPHASETWAMTGYTLSPAMCWICNFKANDEVSSDSLLSKLGLQDIYVVFGSNKMRWYGHVERIKGFISQVRSLNVVAQNRSGKLRKSWDEVVGRLIERMDTADP